MSTTLAGFPESNAQADQRNKRGVSPKPSPFHASYIERARTRSGEQKKSNARLSGLARDGRGGGTVSSRQRAGERAIAPCSPLNARAVEEEANAGASPSGGPDGPVESSRGERKLDQRVVRARRAVDSAASNGQRTAAAEKSHETA